MYTVFRKPPLGGIHTIVQQLHIFSFITHRYLLYRYALASQDMCLHWSLCSTNMVLVTCR